MFKHKFLTGVNGENLQCVDNVLHRKFRKRLRI